MLAVSVSFNDRGVWSKGYTYKSKVPVEKDDLVIVPVGTHWSIGKVRSVKEGYEFKSGIEYNMFTRSSSHDLRIRRNK